MVVLKQSIDTGCLHCVFSLYVSRESAAYNGLEVMFLLFEAA